MPLPSHDLPLDLRHEFTATSEFTWLNCAHQGPLPDRSAAEAREAIDWKQRPYEMTVERFSGLPERLRSALGQVIGVQGDQIVLANSASYGLHLIANGFPWKQGDEVLVAANDFPSDILPFLGLAPRGVTTRRLQPRDQVLSRDEIDRAIGPNTRLLCLTWVHSFSGRAIDLQAIGELCRERGVIFFINGSQAIGARPIQASEAPIDGLTSVGWKWLVGPYGTGFCWFRPELLERLEFNQAYWLAQQTSADLERSTGDIELRRDLGARRYDLFGTANFFNFKPFAASVELVAETGVERIAEHDAGLIDRLIDGLDRQALNLLSPEAGAQRSTLVLVSHRDPEQNQALAQRLRDKGIYCVLRRGNLRISPHLYNRPEDIDRCLEVLNS